MSDEQDRKTKLAPEEPPEAEVLNSLSDELGLSWDPEDHSVLGDDEPTPEPQDATQTIENEPPPPPDHPWGLLIEFHDMLEFVQAVEKVRDAGFRYWDTHTPFPVHGLSDAQGLKMSRLPYVTLVGGIVGCTGAMLMQWWMNGVSYPLVISGKPLLSIPANIPVAFEATILLAAIGTFVGMLAFNNLPLHYHPLLANQRFGRVTTDRFMISIEADDPQFDVERTWAFATQLGGIVEWVED